MTMSNKEILFLFEGFTNKVLQDRLGEDFSIKDIASVVISSENVEYLEEIACYFIIKSRYEELIPFLNNVLNHYPDDSHFSFYLALVYYRLEDISEALAIANKVNFEDIFAYNDCSHDCLNCKKIDYCTKFSEEFLRFLKELNISIESNPQLKEQIESLVETMTKNQMEKDYDGFFDAAHQLIGLIGELPALLTHIGLYYVLNEKYKEAKKYFRKAISLESNYIKTYHYLISIHLDFEEFEQAIGLMKTCHKLNPSDENILVDIACCYLEMNHDKKAFNYFQKAMKINPALPDILLEESDCELYLRLIEEGL